MNEDYASYELALKLKACGFDEPCRCCYVVDKDTESNIKFAEYTSRNRWNSVGVGGSKYPYKHISAPTLWQAQKWLREKKGIAINVDAHDGDFYTWEAVFLSNAAQDTLIEASLSAKFSPYVEKHGSYERALSAGIAAAMELIKKGE